ncbi:hypothetical protein H1R20_g112, partial [Candolleomyces eurysporus]
MHELLLHYEQILAWFEFLLSSPLVEKASKDYQFDLRNPTQICMILTLLLGSDDRLQAAMTSSYSLSNVFLAAWNLRDPKGEPYVSFEGFVDRCLIVTLLLNLADIPSGQQRLYETLSDINSDCDRLQDSCIESAIARLECIKKLDRKAITVQLQAGRPTNFPSPVDASLRYIQMLDWGVVVLTRNPVMRSKLFKSNYPRVLMEALETWLVKRSYRTADRKYRWTGWQTVSEALRSHLEEKEDNSLKPWRQQADMAKTVLLKMVEGGLVSILADALESCSSDTDRSGWDPIATALTLFKAHFTYPSVMCKVAAALRDLRGDNFHDVGFLHGNGNEMYWTPLCTDIALGRHAVLNEPKLISLCDNLKVG